MATKKTQPAESAPLRRFRLNQGVAIKDADGTRHRGECRLTEARCEALRNQGHGDYAPEPEPEG